ncbi:MAG TPA: glycosyltransferase [Clostridia bacterium]|nr:glycosyltransferase [Clostridia bacterium]
MKVLLLTVTAGYGHTQAAKAIMGYLEEHDVECTLLDTLDYINPVLGESVDKGYLYSIKFTPHMYGKIYDLADNRDKADGKFSIYNVMNKILSKKLTTFLENYKPDVVVCTHIFAAQIVSYLQRKNIIKANTIGIITDFTVHPFWEETDLDYYVTANELLNNQASKKGIGLQKILPTGIPIDPKFGQRVNSSKARYMLNIEDKTTILLMSGSTGYGDIESIIMDMDKMDMDFQIISVCGNNKRLKKRIDGLITRKRIYNLGFVDNIHIIMDASDCIVTKPGGLTISESLAKRIPIILINPIPGQEERNAEFLLNNGSAIMSSETYPVDEAIYELMNSPLRRRHLQEMAEGIGRPNATENLGKAIISNTFVTFT